jgi:hypothetical protein
MGTAWKLDKCCHRERERERERERKPYMKVRKHKRENGYLRAFGLLSECLQHSLDSKALLDIHGQSSAKYHKTWCSLVSQAVPGSSP